MGYYVISPVKKVAKHQGTLEEVHDRIKNTIILERASDLALKEAEKIRTQVSPATWEEILLANERHSKDSRLFKQGEFLPEIGRSDVLDKNVFTMKAEEIGPVVQVKDGAALLFKVLERQFPNEKDLDRKSVV